MVDYKDVVERKTYLLRRKAGAGLFEGNGVTINDGATCLAKFSRNKSNIYIKQLNNYINCGTFYSEYWEVLEEVKEIEDIDKEYIEIRSLIELTEAVSYFMGKGAIAEIGSLLRAVEYLKLPYKGKYPHSVVVEKLQIKVVYNRPYYCTVDKTKDIVTGNGKETVVGIVGEQEKKFGLGDRIKITFKDSFYFGNQMKAGDYVYATLIRIIGETYYFNDLSNKEDKLAQQECGAYSADFRLDYTQPTYKVYKEKTVNTQCIPPLPEVNNQEQKTFNPLLKKEMTTLTQEIFDRFLKSNKTKVIEAVELAEINMQVLCDLVNPLTELKLNYDSAKSKLERAYEMQNKTDIRKYLADVQELNKLMEDTFFSQMVTIGNSVARLVKKRAK